MADQNILVQVGADISNLTSGLTRAARQVASFGNTVQGGLTEAARAAGVYRDAQGRLRDVNGRFISDTERIRLGINSAADSYRSFANAADSIGAIGRGLSVMGIALAAGLGGAVKSAADFDTAIRKAGAIAGASASELDDMKKAALDLGATTSKSAKEVANAMTELAAKGFDANQTIAAMPGIIKAAEASGEDLALVSDTITSALNAFRMEASEANKVADVMAMTANKSAAGIADMQYAFKYAAPAAAQLGISMEELAAATGIMAKQNWSVAEKFAA
jgi:hypothetical protein